MADSTPSDALLEHLFRRESARVIGALTRRLGLSGLDMAEDAYSEAVSTALREWRIHGAPENPAAWLFRVAQNRVIDTLRREANFTRKVEGMAAAATSAGVANSGNEPPPPNSDREDADVLGLMFACCHPILSVDSQVALILKSLAGFSTREIAAAYFLEERTLAQRLVRAKRALAAERETFGIPAPVELPRRLDAVLRALYLIFNEGYRSRGSAPTIRAELCAEAIRWTDHLARHPRCNLPKTQALLGLFCFQASRLDSRTNMAGTHVPLEEQDRATWDAALIEKGLDHLKAAGAGDHTSKYHWEAAIASCHAIAPSFAATNWRAIREAYEGLLEVDASSLVRMNYAVAVAHAEDARAGLAVLAAIPETDPVTASFDYAATKAGLLVMAERHEEAEVSYAVAASRAESEADERFVRSKLDYLRTR